MRFSPTPWLVAALAFIILGFTRGLHSSFGVFYVALLDNFGWSRGATAGVFSMVLTVDAILSPVVGHLLDRFGTKTIACAGCLALTAGLFLSSSIDRLWQLYIFFGFGLRSRHHLYRHGAARFLNLRVVRVQSCFGNRFRLCGHRFGHLAARAHERMVAFKLGLGASLSNFWRHSVNRAPAAGLGFLPAWALWRKTSFEEGTEGRRQSVDGKAGAAEFAILVAFYRADLRRFGHHGHCDSPSRACRRRGI